MRAAALALFAPLALAACGDPPLDGFVWDVTLTGAEDLCNAEPIGYQDTLSYRLTFEGSLATVSIGPDPFATGNINGCNLVYESVVWGEDRGTGYSPVKWKITGQADYRQTTGCDQVLPENVDWKGTEVFEIISSDDPNIPPGCTYTLDAEGVYVGPADG